MELLLQAKALVAILHSVIDRLQIFFRRVDDIVLREVASVEPTLHFCFEGDTSCLPLLGRDEDDPVSCTCTIESRSRGIL